MFVIVPFTAQHNLGHLAVHVVNGQIERRRVVCVLHCDVSALVQQQLDRLHVTAAAREVQGRVLRATLPV